MNAGKSSNLAWNWKNWVKTDRVSSEVPVEMAAASVGPNAATLSKKSIKAMQRRKPSAPVRRRNGILPALRCNGALVAVPVVGAVAWDDVAAGGGGAVTGPLPAVLASSMWTKVAPPASLVLMVAA